MASMAAAMASLPNAAAEEQKKPQPSGHSGRRDHNDHNERPNVILMICDDLGYGDLGCYGSNIPTPNLDRMAAAGVRCTRYNSAHPICSASRAAVLTGRYAPRSHTQGAYFPHAKSGMSLDETTLADLFRKRGYRTHAVGKWHLGDGPDYLPTSRGFDSFFGVPYSDDMAPLPLMRDKEIVEPETDRAELTPVYTAEAVKLLETASTDPFFLYVAYSYPHDPARGSRAYKGKSAFGDYGDAVEEIDWSAGKILEALEKSGKASNTVVIFTSDHGPWFQGSHGLTRGRKGSCFEGGVRVPCIIRWPGRIPAASVCSEWLSSLNLLPTLSAWCGLAETTLPLDGHDMTHTLIEREKAPVKPVIYFSPAGNKNDVHCIRTGAWKLRVAQNSGEIYTNDHTMGADNFWLPNPELYHLERDPLEAYSVAKGNPEIVQQLMNDLEKEMLTFPPDVQAEYARLKTQKASVVTPPGAAPRILKPEQLRNNFSYEPIERRPG